MSTEQHEALRLSEWLAGMVCIHPQISEDDPGGYATEYDQKVDEGRLTIIAQYALIVQMAEALEKCRFDSLNMKLADLGEISDALAAATQYLKGPKP